MHLQMTITSAAVFLFLAVPGNAVTREAIRERDVGFGKESILEQDLGFGNEFEEAVETDQDQLLGRLEDVNFGRSLEGKPSKRRSSSQMRRGRVENLTSTLDEMLPVLEADFKSKTQHLKVALAYFKEKQHDMEVARRAATDAMKALRQEADRRRKTATERKAAKDKERLAILEAKRTAKEAMVKKAQALMGAKGQSDNVMLSDTALGTMVNVLMALPAAVENPIFTKRLNRAKEDAVNTVQDFLNITRRKTSKFVLAASKASDVELSFLLARYFHEASFRVKALQSDAQKVARDLNVVMPRKLRTSFNPILKQLRSNAVPLRVNASQMAEQTLSQACTQMGQLMANITQYDNQLNTLHTGLHNVWQMSELMLPHMSKVYPLKSVVIDTVKDFMSMATTQVAGLQESSDEIVTNIGPVVMERMQCTWSSARAHGAGIFALLASLAGFLFY
mmetsp:Transcript_41713/g.116443  ORF Transcript_41713/g.116443 Transcript_41713/m.116443 type:complete len:450 (+) Transcript_41713:98-1447(+)